MKVYEDRILSLNLVKLKGRDKKFDVIKSKNAVAILPILGKRVVLESQYRVATRSRLYEIPAGHIEKGETPKIAALRELKEETGYTAKRIRYMFSAYSSPGYLTEKLYFYLATDLEKGAPKREPNENISIRVMDLDTTLEKIKKKEITDMKTIAALEFYKLFYARPA